VRSVPARCNFPAATRNHEQQKEITMSSIEQSRFREPASLHTIPEGEMIRLHNLINAMRAMARPIEESEENPLALSITPGETASILHLASDQIEQCLSSARPANMREAQPPMPQPA